MINFQEDDKCDAIYEPEGNLCSDYEEDDNDYEEALFVSNEDLKNHSIEIIGGEKKGSILVSRWSTLYLSSQR